MRGSDDGRITPETRDAAADAIIRAAAATTPAEIGELAMAALAEDHGDMSPAQIRALAVQAVAQAQQVSHLMNRLADLLELPAQEGGAAGGQP